MKTIFFITSNKGKFRSAKSALKKYGIRVIQKEIDIPESRGSIEEIAVQKARYAYKSIRKPLIAMDAGFLVHSLNGFPGMFVNFVLETIGVEGIVKLVKGERRLCEFKEVLCYCDNLRTKPKLFERIVAGRISSKPLGTVKPYHWSKLALIFIPKGYKKTMAQMSRKEFTKFKVSVDKNSHWEQFGRFFS